MAISNGSGVGRKKPTKRAGHNVNNDNSLDDDPTQVPSQIVGFTVQSMISANNNSALSANGNNTNLYQMDV